MLLPSTSALSVPLMVAQRCKAELISVRFSFLVQVVLDIVIHNERPEHFEMIGQGLVLLSVASWLAFTERLLSTMLGLQM